MRKNKRQLIVDAVLIFLSIYVGLFLHLSGLIESFINHIGDFRFLSAFVGGLFFTSIFTSIPSIIFFSGLSLSVPIWEIAILGGIGAVVGDLIIFTFVRDRFSEDLKFLLSDKTKRFQKIFKTKLFDFFLSFIGALIIASPFPDEFGITMLGLSKVKKINFVLISFLLNSLGILFISHVASLVIN